MLAPQWPHHPHASRPHGAVVPGCGVMDMFMTNRAAGFTCLLFFRLISRVRHICQSYLSKVLNIKNSRGQIKFYSQTSRQQCMFSVVSKVFFNRLFLGE